MAEQIAEFSPEEEENHLEDASENEAAEPEHSDIPAKLKKILAKDGNLVSEFDDSDILDILGRVTKGYEADMYSMEDRMDQYKDIVSLAVMRPDVANKTFPFPGASQVVMPILAQACIDFQSRIVPEVVNKRNIVSVFRWGGLSDDKEAIGERRSSAINFQFKKGIQSWQKNQDRAMGIIAMGGMVFKKTWWCCHKIEQSLVTADKLIYDYDAPSFEEAPRKSMVFHLDPNDYESNVISDKYTPIQQIETLKQEGKQPENIETLELIESHCTLDLDGDGYCEPYIVTWSQEYDCIVRIEKNFNEDDVRVKNGRVVEITPESFFTQYGFIPNPEKGAVYDGFGTLMFDALKAINTMTRQALDASTLSIVAANSGFISSQLKAVGSRQKSGKTELIMGQFTHVDMGAGQSMRDMIWTPQFQGVPQGFYQMLTDMKNSVMQYCSASQSIDVTAGEAASLYLGRLQQALKVPNAIMSRVYMAVAEEAKRIDNLLQRYLPDEEYKEVVDWRPKIPVNVKIQYQQALQAYQQAAQQGIPAQPPLDPIAAEMQKVTKANDYAHPFEFITTADPTMGSYEERVSRKEMIANRAIQLPQLYNLYETERDLLIAIGDESPDRVLIEPTGQPTQQEQLTTALTQAEIMDIQASAQHKAAQAQKASVQAQLDQMKAESEIDLNMSNVMKNLTGIDNDKAKIELASLDTSRKDLEVALRHLYQTGDVMQGQVDRQHQLTMQANDHAHQKSMSVQDQTIDHPVHGKIGEQDIHDTMAANGLTRQEVMDKLDHHAAVHNTIKRQIVIPNHPKHGHITEADIQTTMKNNNMTRQDVLSKLNA